MSKKQTKTNDNLMDLVISHARESALSNSPTSSKKRKVESTSNSLMVVEDSSEQEPSSISTTSTLAEVLVQITALQKTVSLQAEQIALQREQLSTLKKNGSTQILSIAQNACAGGKPLER
jgi:hypothetical protein